MWPSRAKSQRQLAPQHAAAHDLTPLHPQVRHVAPSLLLKCFVGGEWIWDIAKCATAFGA